jgi:hypothetical protein
MGREARDGLLRGLLGSHGPNTLAKTPKVVAGQIDKTIDIGVPILPDQDGGQVARGSVIRQGEVETHRHPWRDGLVRPDFHTEGTQIDAGPSPFGAIILRNLDRCGDGRPR